MSWMIPLKLLAMAASTAVLASSVSLVSGPPAPALAAIPAELGPCVAGWREMPIPDAAFVSTPFEVVTRNGKQAWVLGGSNQGVLALEWNGSAWKRRATGTRGHRGLIGGEALGARKVLGVGYYRPSRGEGEGSLDPISGRVVSGTWRGRPVPDPTGPRATLTDVVGLPGGKAWAVGTRLVDGRLRAYAVRWNGKRWSRQEPPGGSGSGLLAIERTNGGTIWAVGWKEAKPGKPRPYIVKRSGGGWRKVPSAAVPAGSAVLTDLSFRSGRDGWAVGYLARKRSDRHTAILQRWDGESWSRVDVPWAGDFAALPRSVSAGEAPGEVWVAGTQTATDRREARGFIAHLQDGVWDVDVLGVPGDISSEVMDVAATRWGAVAAAGVGASLLVLKSCQESPATAAGNRAGRDRVAVSAMQARREAVDDIDDGADIDGEASAVSIATATGTGAPAVTIAAPVEPTGFQVRDTAAAAGLAEWTKTYDGFAADLDRNGYRDVFYSRHGSIMPRLAMNTGAGFSDASTSAFSPVDRHGCDAADVDKDGNKDILCVVGAARGKTIGRHELSLAPLTSAATLAAGGLGISDPLGRGRHVAFIKLDGDGFAEVFIADAPDRNDGLPGYNRFYRNGGGRFKPAPGVGLDSSHGAECVEVTDVDRDGDQDLLYCTQYGFAGRPVGLRFMRNEGGKLKDRTRARGIRQIGDIDVAVADVTGDGRKDLIQLSTTRLRVSKWTRDGYRKIYEAKIAHAWAVAAGDASGDGKADIYIVRGNDRDNKADRLLVSRKRGTRFVSVTIPQTTKGSADDVISLDYDKNGHTDFVVLNGRKRAGPIQLIASFPE